MDGTGDAVQSGYPRGGAWHDRHACPTISRGASQADRDALERARSRKPPDRGGINRIGPSNVGHRLTGGEALQRLLALMRRHLAGSAEAHAAILRTLATLARASTNQLALELGETADRSAASSAPAPPIPGTMTMMSAGATGSLTMSAHPAARRTGSRTEGTATMVAAATATTTRIGAHLGRREVMLGFMRCRYVAFV